MHWRTLAHHGVLFLDEFTEFRRDAIEGLRQPLKDERVLSRGWGGSLYQLDAEPSDEDTASRSRS